MNTKNADTLSPEEAKEQEIAALRARLAELEAQSESKNDITDIRPDEYIKVISLVPHTLILSTRPNGGGDIKKFTKFGETKRILYRDLLNIMEANPSFVSNGYFYIADKKVVRANGLDDVYEGILTKEQIEKVLTASPKEVISIYQSANDAQKEIIIEFVMNKLAESKGAMSLDSIDALERVSNKKIMDSIEYLKNISNVAPEEE
ncbi:MAG TPA: hypothetical protein PLT50_01405 [bacterium]|nr:hypothetical protein [bacterium]